VLNCFISVAIYRYRVFGDPPSQRSAEDIAFAVARFFSVGGSMVNYYMVHMSNLLLTMILNRKLFCLAFE
jgi:hypothetical protein